MSRIRLPLLAEVPWESLNIGDEVRNPYVLLPQYTKKPADPMPGVIVELENIPRGWGRVVIQWDDGHFWSSEHSRGYERPNDRQ